MAKDYSSLMESRRIRENMRQQYGFIPRSIIPGQWSLHVEDSFIKGYYDHMKTVDQVGTPWTLSGIGARHGDHSRFPQNVLHFLVKFYTPEQLKEKGYFNNLLSTVFDPFAGHNSRETGVHSCNRNYVGWDCCKEFMGYNRLIADKLMNPYTLFPSEAKIELIEGDSRNINYNEQFDFCLTSPPYWKLEEYGPEKEQLSNTTTYIEFLEELQSIINNCYKALKSDTFIAWEVNDFRWKGEFHIYHADVIQLFKKAGFTIHDIIIVDYLSGFLFKFASQMEESKIIAKTHSYVIIGKKGEKRKFTSREELLEKSKYTKGILS